MNSYALLNLLARFVTEHATGEMWSHRKAGRLPMYLAACPIDSVPIESGLLHSRRGSL